MILSFKMKGNVISDHFLLWFQNDSLDTVGFRTFRTFRGGPGVLNKIVDFGGPKWHLESSMYRGWGATSLGLFPKFYHFLSASICSGHLTTRHTNFSLFRRPVRFVLLVEIFFSLEINTSTSKPLKKMWQMTPSICTALHWTLSLCGCFDLILRCSYEREFPKPTHCFSTYLRSVYLYMPYMAYLMSKIIWTSM